MELLEGRKGQADGCQRLIKNSRQHFVRIREFVFDQDKALRVAFTGKRKNTDPHDQDRVTFRHGLNDFDFVVVKHIYTKFDPVNFRHKNTAFINTCS